MRGIVSLVLLVCVAAVGAASTRFADASAQFRPTLFGQLTDDLSAHSYLALRLRAGGHPRTRNSYFVNVQTDGSFKNDLWQHRLFFNMSDGGWEDVFVRAFCSLPLARSSLPSRRALALGHRSTG